MQRKKGAHAQRAPECETQRTRSSVAVTAFLDVLGSDKYFNARHVCLLRSLGLRGSREQQSGCFSSRAGQSVRQNRRTAGQFVGLFAGVRHREMFVVVIVLLIEFSDLFLQLQKSRGCAMCRASPWLKNAFSFSGRQATQPKLQLHSHEWHSLCTREQENQLCSGLPSEARRLCISSGESSTTRPLRET